MYGPTRYIFLVEKRSHLRSFSSEDLYRYDIFCLRRKKQEPTLSGFFQYLSRNTRKGMPHDRNESVPKYAVFLTNLSRRTKEIFQPTRQLPQQGRQSVRIHGGLYGRVGQVRTQDGHRAAAARSSLKIASFGSAKPYFTFITFIYAKLPVI